MSRASPSASRLVKSGAHRSRGVDNFDIPNLSRYINRLLQVLHYEVISSLNSEGLFFVSMAKRRVLLSSILEPFRTDRVVCPI
jgi:hypothetical protein